MSLAVSNTVSSARACLAVVCLSLGLAQVAAAQGASECGDLQNAYGPYDYTNPTHQKENLPIVERFHFTSAVEALTHGETGAVVNDLDYTLRAFPNHHRALYAMMRYQLKHPQPPGSSVYSIDCYFDRAIRWQPGDENVRLLYGIYLAKKADQEAAGQPEEARKNRDAALIRYNEALALAPDSPEIHYNIGLLYCNLGQLDLARQHAERAYALGYPLPGLRNLLIKRGAWGNASKPPPPG